MRRSAGQAWRTEVWEAVLAEVGDSGKITAKIIVKVAEMIGALPSKPMEEPKPKTDSGVCAMDFALKAIAVLNEMPETIAIEERKAACEEAIRLLRQEVERLGQVPGDTTGSVGCVKARSAVLVARRKRDGLAGGGGARRGRKQRRHASLA